MNREKPISIETDTLSIDKMLLKLEKKEEDSGYPVIIEKMAQILKEKTAAEENIDITNKFLVSAKNIIDEYKIA